MPPVRLQALMILGSFEEAKTKLYSPGKPGRSRTFGSMNSTRSEFYQRPSWKVARLDNQIRTELLHELQHLSPRDSEELIANWYRPSGQAVSAMRSAGRSIPVVFPAIAIPDRLGAATIYLMTSSLTSVTPFPTIPSAFAAE